ncbi:hypothetical protein PACILC2_40570 [Paenibacillus cisolokensis]|uniref:YbbR-like domain-containing protein YbbR n=1 Tax=Paenibacillus cisolokensis TaxID=1658519 RepID=A0ABQ4NB84_9BACL|nr:CdaR family protein [Paenibacillus cisolokensis]GIQ65489.1 hypothetical protein PACILC2_40570 [Paenibacillus cisolokensis]
MDKWLSHPTALKIVSAVIGVLLWAVVHFDPEAPPNTVASNMETKVIEAVKIVPIGMDESTHVLRSMEPSVVRILVRGTRTNLLSANEDEDYQVTVDLTGIVEGKYTLPLKVGQLPRGVELLEMSPNRTTVQVDALITKPFDVTIVTEGEPEDGYLAGTPVLHSDNRVEVTLPKDDMAKVDRVVARIDIAGADKSINVKRVPLIALDKQGNELTNAVIRPATAEVEIPITKEYKVVPLRIGLSGQLPEGLSISSFKPNVKEVKLFGPREALDKIDVYDGPSVNLSEITESGVIELTLNPGGAIQAVEPQKVTVQVEVVPMETRSLEKMPIEIDNVAEQFDATVIEPASGLVDLQVRGAPDILAKLQVKDVRVSVDADGLRAGRHKVKLDVALPPFIELVSASVDSATVQITETAPVIVKPDEPAGPDPPANGEGESDGAADEKPNDHDGDGNTGETDEDGSDPTGTTGTGSPPDKNDPPASREPEEEAQTGT